MAQIKVYIVYQFGFCGMTGDEMLLDYKVVV